MGPRKARDRSFLWSRSREALCCALAAIALQACTGLLNTDILKARGTEVFTLANASLKLKSPKLTQKTQSRFEVQCVNAAAFMIADASSAPNESDARWHDCSTSGTQLIDQSNAPGLHELRLWGKDISGKISGSIDSLYVNRAPYLRLKNPDPKAMVSDPTNAQILLANGNVVVARPSENLGGTQRGRVQLYNGATGELIASYEGATDSDQIASGGVLALANGNFAFASPLEDVANLSDAGRVRLIDGETGDVLSDVAGEFTNDQVGVSGLFALSNNRVLVLSRNARYAGQDQAGTIVVLDATSGQEVTRFGGENAYANLGEVHLILANGNIVLTEPGLQVGALDQAGAAILFDGQTSQEIGRTVGDDAFDQLGHDLYPLSNGNYVIGNISDYVGGLSSAGAAILVDGQTGHEIDRVEGDNFIDQFSLGGITELGNGDYIVRNWFDQVSSQSAVGSLVFVNGSTGAELTRAVGAQDQDMLGFEAPIDLGNGNFAAGSTTARLGANTSAGVAMLINGTTGAKIDTVRGAREDDFMHVIAGLSNGNYLIGSPYYDKDGTHADTGLVILKDGLSGAEVARFEGATAGDQVGSRVFALSGARFAIISPFEDVSGVADRGTLRIVDGTSGTVLMSLSGDLAGDELGGGTSNFSAESSILLPDGRLILASPAVDNSSHVDVGSLTVVDTTNLQVLSTIYGDNDGDKLGFDGIEVVSGSRLMVKSSVEVNSSGVQAGGVRLFRLDNYAELSRLEGASSGDGLGVQDSTTLSSFLPHIVISAPLYKEASVPDADLVFVLSNDQI
jgi:hypothetical protein